MGTATDNASDVCLMVTRAASGKLEAKSRFEAKKSRDVPVGFAALTEWHARILDGQWDKRNVVTREAEVRLENWEVEVNSVDEEWTHSGAWEIVKRH